ncbi:hypothetical protein Q5Y75_09445 [Ruegeria sp. 2205SS24-7]|uniref:hypothetical protein n=1 Tax=Ruegeria discodermiae TaxID=3064389 RepID=UPI002741A401|nr:hypothetical protein [Ruegeria sp. 2205SS24-7]MDP5217439.1 hypothetical protein [Ruegeria sp. 2205SS24-7]
MTRGFIKMTMGLGLMALAAQQLHAQQRNCAPREVVLDRLSEKYGESRRGIGLVQQGSVMEVFASDDTGTWTITVTLTNGMTCLVASGQSYEALAEAIPARGEKA